VTPLNAHSRLIRNSDLLSTDLDGEIVLMSIERGNYYGMELTGRWIWELLAQEQTVAELCRQLSLEYDVEPTTCERDVLTFLEELHHEGLIITA
jgi:hypothetical protein